MYEKKALGGSRVLYKVSEDSLELPGCLPFQEVGPMTTILWQGCVFWIEERIALKIAQNGLIVWSQ